MKGRWLPTVATALLVSACGEQRERAAELPPQPVQVPMTSGATSPPTLRNREEVIAYRNEAARTLLPAGDSLTVHVFARIDEKGEPHQAEVKADITDARISGAAISVVQLMKFNPALEDGQPVSVLLKIPVRFVHAPQ